MYNTKTTISVNDTHHVYIYLLLCLIQTVKRLIGNLFYSYVDHGESAVLHTLVQVPILHSTIMQYIVDFF